MGTPSKSPPLNPLKTPKLEMENSSKAFLPLEKNALEDALVSMHFQLLLFRVKIILGHLDFYNCQLHRFVHNRKSL